MATGKDSLDNMEVLTTPHYANVILIGQDGKHLSTISYKKARWYLSKNLATEVPAPAPYSRALQLNFTHKQKDDSEKWDLAVSDNQCVICGTTEDLTLHHIVPRVIRRHFPFEVKGHSREWCTLLCEPCHMNVEMVTQPIYKKDFPHYKQGEKDMNLALQVIKSKGNLEKIPVDKLTQMMAQSDYKNVDDIPLPNLDKQAINLQRSNNQLALIEVWANNFIKDHGGIDGTHQYFYDLFLTFKPQYLPKWFRDLRNK